MIGSFVSSVAKEIDFLELITINNGSIARKLLEKTVNLKRIAENNFQSQSAYVYE